MNNHILKSIVISTLFATSVYAQPNLPLENATNEVLKLSQIGEKNLTPEESKLLFKNVKLRLENMKANINTPNIFIKYLLPNKITQKLPHHMQAYLEDEVTNLEGTLEVLAATTNNEPEALQYILHTSDDKTYNLHFSDTPPADLQTDQRVKIKHAFVVPVTPDITELVLTASEITILQKVAALPLSFGPQTTIAILVNFSDKPTTRPWTVDYVKDLVFNQINNSYYEMSYHQTTVVGQTAGWYVINMPSTTACSSLPNTMESLANQAVKNAGIDITKFHRRLYIFPRTSTCSWNGLGTVGGTTTRAFINGSMSDISTPAHEMGHNIGLRHAQALRCPSSPIEGSCTVSEYGDAADLMGNDLTGHFNAFEKDRLGWLNYNISPPITTVTKSGSYFIDAYATNTKLPKALKILKRAGGSDYYYLELRTPVGFDKILESCGTSCDFTKGISFHQGNPSGSNPSQLLDMTPGGGNKLVTLYPCKSWKDPAAPNGGVTFTVQSISSQGARVQVTFGGLVDQCHRHSPSFKLLPGYTQWLEKGKAETITVAIQNNDSEKCSARDFSIPRLAVNSILSITPQNETVKVAPGATQIIKLSTKSNYIGVPFIHSTDLILKDNVSANPNVVPLSFGLLKS